MEISRETYDKATPETKDSMMFDMQFNTYETVQRLDQAVQEIAPIKKDVKWLTWGFRFVYVSIAGLALRVIGLK